MKQDRASRRRRAGPLVAGTLACGALLMTAPGALAHHMMANGMLCPHAAGEPVPGEGPATVNPTGAASTAPLAAAGATQTAPKPAAKPSSQPKAQQPASQAQAQKPATAKAPAQAQVQRPAVASAPAARAAVAPVPVKVRSTTPAPRQAPVARSSVAKAPRVKVERPVAQQQTSPRPVSAVARVASGGTAEPASPALGTLLALLALLALGALAVAGAVALAFARRRTARLAATAAPLPAFLDEPGDAIEAELQAMIVESRARMAGVSGGLDDAELSATR